MKKSLILALCAAGAIAGCGGGDDDRPAPTAEVPASAGESPGGFVSYLSALIASPDTDSLDPVDISNLTPPTDDDGGPTVVD